MPINAEVSTAIFVTKWKLADGLKPVTPMSVHLLAKGSFIDYYQMDKMMVTLVVEQLRMSVGLKNKLLAQVIL